MNGFFEDGLHCLVGAILGFHWCMSLVYVVISTEEYQTGTAVKDYIKNRTISEDQKSAWVIEANGHIAWMETFSCRLL